MDIVCKHVYDKTRPTDDNRVLVDRIWPRGMSKKEVGLEKNITPSSKLHKQFQQGSLNWVDFSRKYLGELRRHRHEIRELARMSLKKLRLSTSRQTGGKTML
ncbi:MAG TPA: hypothetical protein VJ969_12760 [Desulfopila sp.]|nr:hypothetical protein [Desulfopila sp.]